MGQIFRLGKTNRLICKRRMEIYFFGFYDFLFFTLLCEFFIFYLAFILFVTFQNHQVMATSWVAVVRPLQESPGAPIEVHKGWNLCLCGGGGRRCRCGGVVGGGGVDCSDGGDAGGCVHGNGGNSGESRMCRSGGGSGNVVDRSVRGGLCGSS